MLTVTEVVDALKRRGTHFELIHHPAAMDAAHEAQLLDISAGDVLKAILLDTTKGHVLLVVPGNRRLDMTLVRDAVGDRHARLASEGEIVRDIPGCQLGGLPALGSVLSMPVYIEPEVFEHPVVAFAAGTQTDSIKCRLIELLRGESVTIAPLTERYPEARLDNH